MTNPQETVDVDLSGAERDVLNRGLIEWGGPARCTEAMASAMGFANVQGLSADGRRIADAIQSGQPLTRRDWTRALLATEIVFISDVTGSGIEWTTTTGLDDIETLHAIRSIQHKLAGVTLGDGTWR